MHCVGVLFIYLFVLMFINKDFKEGKYDLQVPFNDYWSVMNRGISRKTISSYKIPTRGRQLS